MSTTVVCPSGASVVVRGMRGKELKVLSDRKALRDGSFLDQLLNACVEKVIDPGPYKVTDSGSLNWDTVLSGDRLYLPLSIRVATFGPTFAFVATCGQCEKKKEYDVDLTELPVKSLSDDDREAFASGNRLTTEFPGTGAKVTFRLTTGADEKRMLRQTSAGKQTQQDDAMLSMLTLRIESIEGVERVKTFMEEASLNDVMTLAKSMNARDCGVDNEIKVPCPECEEINTLRVPLGVSFLLPR